MNAIRSTSSSNADVKQQPGRRTVVTKVGGSLLDLPDLQDRIVRFIRSLGTHQVVLVIGGGPAADVVRMRDEFDRLGEEKAHWLATRALTFNSYLVEGLLDGARVVTSLDQCRAVWSNGGAVPILDPHPFLLSDSIGTSPLPRSWRVTSDSIAARVARALAADELVLLKSVSWTGPISEAAGAGIVDRHFTRELADAPSLAVRIENLREIAVCDGAPS